MAAPKGNKYALGNKGGRPPVMFSKEDLVVLGEELLEWMKQNDDNNKIVHMSQWYSEIKEINYSVWKSMVQCRDEFLPYYERFRLWMARKTMQNKDLRESYGNRFLAVYAADLRETEREISREKISDEIELKSKVSEMASPEQIALNKAIVEGISKLQEKNSTTSSDKP